MNKDKTTLFNNVQWFFWMGVILLVLAAGCVSKPEEIARNETTADPLPYSTAVSPAPIQLYIKAGQSEQFRYWGHNITVNYSSSYPIQTIQITTDGTDRIFQKEATESPIGFYCKEGNLSFFIKPVLWEIRDGQKIPFYESTWNTTEIYFEVQVMLSSNITRGQKR